MSNLFKGLTKLLTSLYMYTKYSIKKQIIFNIINFDKVEITPVSTDNRNTIGQNSLLSTDLLSTVTSLGPVLTEEIYNLNPEGEVINQPKDKDNRYIYYALFILG